MRDHCLECLKGNSYIWSIAKSIENWSSSVEFSSAHVSTWLILLCTIFTTEKPQTKNGEQLSYSYKRNVAWLLQLYCCFHGKCSNKFYSIVFPNSLPPSQLNPTPRCVSTEANHSHSICIHLVRSKFHLDSFLSRSLALWNRNPGGCFHDHKIVDLFMSGVSR